MKRNFKVQPDNLQIKHDDSEQILKFRHVTNYDHLVGPRLGGKVEVKARLKVNEDETDPEAIWQLLHISYENLSLLFLFLLPTHYLSFRPFFSQSLTWYHVLVHWDLVILYV